MSLRTNLDTTSPYYLNPSDGPQIRICPIVLRGENYHECVRSMRNNFRAKNKLGFLTGIIEKPKAKSPEHPLWVTVNSTLVGWIHNTLDPVLRSSVPQPDDVQDIWEDLTRRFSIGNGPRIHELKNLLNDCKQRGQPVVNYYNDLRKLWDELAGYSKVPACTCAAASAFIKEKENEKVHDFCVGLDSNLYGNVVSNIFMTEPLPSLNTAFSKIVTEERHQTVARAQETKSDVVGFAAYAGTRNRGPVSDSDHPQTSSVCSHCAKPGHDKENYFKLNGFPEWWYSENRVRSAQGRGGGRGGNRGGGRGGWTVANAEATSKQLGTNCPPSAQLAESDRIGLQGLSDEQWTTLVSLLNSSKGQSSSTDKLNGPHLEDFHWSG